MSSSFPNVPNFIDANTLAGAVLLEFELGGMDGEDTELLNGDWANTPVGSTEVSSNQK